MVTNSSSERNWNPESHLSKEVFVLKLFELTGLHCRPTKKIPLFIAISLANNHQTYFSVACTALSLSLSLSLSLMRREQGKGKGREEGTGGGKGRSPARPQTAQHATPPSSLPSKEERNSHQWQETQKLRASSRVMPSSLFRRGDCISSSRDAVLSVLPDISAEHTFEVIPKSMILVSLEKNSPHNNLIQHNLW